CSFDNVGRVTMAAAAPSYSSSAKTVNGIGDLTTVRGGKVTVKGLVSPGLQSLELIADTIDTSGTIDTNLRAENHPESGMIIVDRGSKVVGAGGINMFTGRLKVSYEGLAVKSATLSSAWSTIKGKFRAATIAIASPNNIAIDADMSTMSDALSTSQHNGKLYAPTEGVFIQSLGKYKSKEYQNIHVKATAKLSSDNHLSLKSLSNIHILKQGNKQAKVIGGDMTLIALNEVHQQGYVAADEVKVSANQFINTGLVESANIDVETEESIYNSFGGKVLGKNVTLYSKSGAVINGSRADKAVFLDKALTIGGEGYEVKKQFGIWQSLDDDPDIKSQINSANSVSTVSASILADNLDIQAKIIENINPYRLKKADSVNWDAGIRVNGIKANQVAIEAERSIKLKASEYVLNSSAIMGLNGGGEFLVNSPIFSNERYEISFESYPYRVVEYSQDDSKKNEIGHYKSGTETKILTYSPPGRVFSFGDFQFSRGGTSDPKKVQSSKLFNEISYFQAFKDVRFFNSTIKSIGLEIGTDTENTDFEGMTSCLNYRRCNREYVTTRTEAETLLAFEGNVSGVNGEVATESDLVIRNINSVDTDKQIVISNIVKNYISQNKKKIDDHPNNILVKYLSSMYSTFTYEYRLSNVEVVSDVIKGEVLVYTAYTSKPSNWPKGQPWSDDYKDFTKSQYSKPYKFEVNWKEKYDEEQGDKELGSTGYTDNQWILATSNYLDYKGGINHSYPDYYNRFPFKLCSHTVGFEEVSYFYSGFKHQFEITFNQKDSYTLCPFRGPKKPVKNHYTPVSYTETYSEFKTFIPYHSLNEQQRDKLNGRSLSNSKIERALKRMTLTMDKKVIKPKVNYRVYSSDSNRPYYISHSKSGNNVDFKYGYKTPYKLCYPRVGCKNGGYAYEEHTKRISLDEVSHYLVQ
ncbi:FhaB protein, partial [Vibrio diabolicus]|uniref:FhaB protein n=1 Tax=Vibrio diabolicus TaxID=50719 RepID=UPI0035A93218